MKRALVITVVILSVAGLIDASYLAASHYSDTAVVCGVGDYQFGQCDTVLSSEYSQVFGIPLGFVGMVYYFVLLVLSSMLLPGISKKTLMAIQGISGLGFLASVYFVYLQLFIINSVCIYCMASAAVTTLVFFITLFALKQDTNPNIV